MGVPMFEHTFQPGRDNLAGNFEDMEFSRCCKVLQPNWREPNVLRDNSEAKAEIGRLAYARCRDHRTWGVKEPRLCYVGDALLERLYACRVLAVYTSRDLWASVRSLLAWTTKYSEPEAAAVEHDCDETRRRFIRRYNIPAMQIRYEDVVNCACPHIYVDRIAEFVGVEPTKDAYRHIRPDLNRQGGVPR